MQFSGAVAKVESAYRRLRIELYSNYTTRNEKYSENVELPKLGSESPRFDSGFPSGP